MNTVLTTIAPTPFIAKGLANHSVLDIFNILYSWDVWYLDRNIGASAGTSDSVRSLRHCDDHDWKVSSQEVFVCSKNTS